MESGTVLSSTAGALGNFELSFNVANKVGIHFSSLRYSRKFSIRDLEICGKP